jgi:hypothetical protein
MKSFRILPQTDNFGCLQKRQPALRPTDGLAFIPGRVMLARYLRAGAVFSDGGGHVDKTLNCAAV